MTDLESRIACMLLGDGIVTSTPASEHHRRMRKALASSFSSASIASLSPTFFRHARGLVDTIQDQIQSHRACSPDPLPLDVVPLLNAVAFDILAEAGLGYESGCVESLRARRRGDSKAVRDPLAAAFDSTNAAFTSQHPVTQVCLTFLGYMIPPLASSSIFARNRAIKTSRRRMEKLALKMIEDRTSSPGAEMEAYGHIDIVSRLMFAARNSATAAKKEKDILVAQISAFLFAGHETTASTLSWLILSLATHQGFQARLARSIEGLDWEHAASDPLVEATVKEVLRLHPPSRVLRRTTKEDGVILPLSRPLRDSKDELNGNDSGDLTKLVVPEGQDIVIGLAAINRSKDLWGVDADDFSPDRWFALPASHEGAHLPYDLASFGFGPKTCLGARFALFELKVLTAALVQHFHFIRRPDIEIVTRQGLFFRPAVKGEERMGPQLPVLVTLRERFA
ncbi:unnamed protein product [Tilletia controversa]|uniref:Cytochrome P450 n=4 Tax=Tilletia TaxID=13289 RepID=A0A8X7SZB7_9BASI|nr:hypothetical protein CF335_g936 [Tilletia laevis]KAE8253103.1 hypothetical protein A4X06_0g1699 [Tilletia controversa]CAD6884876.1 unnamed protein product [Tilletia caries]CAD6904604.1 unnamed protein product [Tilletia laevis]CAD6919082.1 unnamed protein product [Tilletia caries]